MDQSQRAPIVKMTLIVSAVSIVLSQLMIGNFLFTIPLIALAPRYLNRRQALMPVGIVALLVALIELIRSSGFPSSESRVLGAVSLFVPAVLLVGSAVWITLDGYRLLYRYLASCLFAVVASISIVIWFSSAGEAILRVDSMMSESFRTLFAQFSGSAIQYDATMNLLYRTMVMILGAVLAPMMMAIMGFAFYVALSFQSRGSEEPFVVRFSRIRLPENGIWVFLSGWTLVLVFVLVKSGYLPRALAIQCALSISLLYAIQGFAIILFHLVKRNLVHRVGRLGFMVVLLMFMVPGLNLLVVFALPLLGVTETWIAYRRNV
jgi:hypothetical protein